MPWKYNYTKLFYEKALKLSQNYQKIQVSRLITQIKALEHPKDIGAPYLNAWSYVFGNKGIIQCDIDELEMTVTFTNIMP